MGTVGSTNGVTQFDAASAVSGQTVDGSPFGSVTGVTVGNDGTVTAQFSNGLSQNVYQIPDRDLHQSRWPAGSFPATPMRQSKNSGGANINQAGHRRRRHDQRPIRWKARPSIWPRNSPT